MRKFLLFFVLYTSLFRGQCNMTVIPNDICYNYDTLNIPSSKQNHAIYICGSNAVVYDTLDPVSFKFRYVFIQPGSTYHCKTTLSNSSMQIWAKSGANIIIHPGTNTGFLFQVNQEPGVNVINLSAGTISNNICGNVTGPPVSCIPTGINGVRSITYEISVWPNPTNGKIYISAKEEDKAQVSINVINHLGEVVLSGEYLNNGKKELSLEKFPSGIYFVRMKSGNITETKKIILLK